MKLHYRQLLKDGEDTYSSPYENMAPEDWRHLIDDVWATDKHKVRYYIFKFKFCS